MAQLTYQKDEKTHLYTYIVYRACFNEMPVTMATHADCAHIITLIKLHFICLTM